MSQKLGAPCWSPARYPDGVARAASRVLDVSCLVLDYDDGTTLKEAHRQWAEWPHVIHTSWSHTAAHPKCRVVVPLLRAIPVASWARAHHWALSQTTADRVCKDASRIYFVPSHPDGALGAWAGVWEGSGRMLDLDPATLPPTPDEVSRAIVRARPPRVMSGTPTQIARAASDALKVDADARYRAGEALGAVMTDARADRMPCPGCGRSSVFFMIQPGAWNGARCSHRNSCGWAGWVDQLLLERA